MKQSLIIDISCIRTLCYNLIITRDGNQLKKVTDQCEDLTFAGAMERIMMAGGFFQDSAYYVQLNASECPIFNVINIAS